MTKMPVKQSLTVVSDTVSIIYRVIIVDMSYYIDDGLTPISTMR